MRAKVKCQDCASYENDRCEIRMKYMTRDLPRFCRNFQAKTQTLLHMPGKGGDAHE